MYYRNFKWPEAATELALVVNGGKDTDGVEIKPIELTTDIQRSPEYYFTYGLVLVKLNRCGDALPLFQKLLATVQGDEIAVYNANEGIRLCGLAAGTTPSPENGTPAGTASSASSETLTVTPTP
jgi:hypothetical protein